MKSVWFRLILGVALTSGWGLAQTSRGTVSGLVLDPQNLTVPGADVELTNLDTNVVRLTQTNGAGLYRFDAVDPGRYKAVISLTGFQAFSTSGFEVAAAQVKTLDVNLELGESVQTIEVIASPITVQAEAPVRGGTIPSESILDLPYASRNPVSLSLTVPGVVTNKFDPATKSFSVNGARGRSNNFLIDGTDNNDISVAGQAFEIRNPGSIQEVSIQTTNYDSEFGRAGGAVVNVITKSGTNQLHGTLGFSLHSTRLDAISSSLGKDPAIRERGYPPAGTQQQFDGTLGGPIIRDRLFFHASYMEVRQFSTGSSEMISPTAAGRATLLQVFPKGTSANADLLQEITAGNDGLFDTFTVPLGSSRPNIEFGRLIIPFRQSEQNRQYGAKMDYNWRDSDLLSGRFLIDNLLQPKGGQNRGFPSLFTSLAQKTTSIALYHTHIFSPTFVNELRPGFTRLNFEQPLDPENPRGLTLPQIAIAGINTLTTSVYGIESRIPQGKLFNNYTLQDTATVTNGPHSFRFGFELMNQRARQAAPANVRGQLQYGASSGAQAFSGLANFLDDFGGAGSAGRTFANPFFYPSLFRQSYFVQDRWRVRSDTTMSMGLRYEYFGTPMNVTLNPVYSELFNVDPVTLDSPLLHANKAEGDLNNWSPSIGLAYAPSFQSGWRGRLLGDRKFSLRLGYGLGYDAYFNNITSNIVASAPASVAALTTSSLTAANPRGLPGLSSLLPIQPPALTPFLTQNSVVKHILNPYYQRWSVTVQREVGTGLLFDLGYVGTKGTKLFATEDGNPLATADLRAPVPVGFTGTPQARVDPLQGARNVRTNGAASTYHAMQLEVKRRVRGFMIGGVYTFSKLIDNASEIFTIGGTSTLQSTGVPAMFGGLQIDKAISSLDRPHRFVMTYTYEFPFFKSQATTLARIAGGWQIVGLTTFESGGPYTVLNGQDADGLGAATFDRPDFNPNGQPGVRAVPNASSSTGYVNPDAGNAPIDPSLARYIGIVGNAGSTRRRPGNLGRNTERAPGIKNWDLNIIKQTKVNDSISVGFRAEFYNLFNTPQYGIVSVSPFAPAQSAQTISANVFTSASGEFLNERLQDGGGRVIRGRISLQF